MKTSKNTVLFLLSFVFVIVSAPKAKADTSMVMSPTVEVRTSPNSTGPPAPLPLAQGAPSGEQAPSEPVPSAAPEAAPQSPVHKGVSGNIVPRDRVTTWDLNLEGALGWAFPESSDNSWQDKRFTGFLRARAGILRVHDSWYFSAGPTYEISKLQPVTFGLQGEVMNLEAGLWLQAGALLDGGAHPGAMGAIGWSMFGLEAQYRVYDKYNLGEVPAVYFKIRLPIGVFFSKYAKREKQ